MGQRQNILRAAVTAGINELRTEAGRSMAIRRRDLAEQMMELRGLRGKNSAVVKHMRSRIEQEQADFDASGSKIHAVRSVHLKQLREVVGLLSTPMLKVELASLTHALQQPGIKLGLKKAYGEAFARLREGLRKAQSLDAEIQAMLEVSFRQLNSEFGFSLQAPSQPNLDRYVKDLDVIERSHLQYLGLGNVFRLSQPVFSERLVRALVARLRVVYEAALADVEGWNKSASSQLDAQLRERRRNFARRLEAVERIQQAASGLDEKISEIDEQRALLNELDKKMTELTSHLIQAPLALVPSAELPEGTNGLALVSSA